MLSMFRFISFLNTIHTNLFMTFKLTFDYMMQKMYLVRNTFLCLSKNELEEKRLLKLNEEVCIIV